MVNLVGYQAGSSSLESLQRSDDRHRNSCQEGVQVGDEKLLCSPGEEEPTGAPAGPVSVREPFHLEEHELRLVQVEL